MPHNPPDRTRSACAAQFGNSRLVSPHAGAPGAEASKQDRLLQFRYGPPTLKLDWALDGPIPWQAPEVRRAGTVHVGGTAQQIRGALSAVAAGTLPDAPVLLLGQQSVADPTRAPAGKHTAWAYTHVPADVDHQAGGEVIEAHVERFAPGFRDRILARHVLGPADLERRDSNLVRGDVGGGSYALDQLVFRPVPSLDPYATPLAGPSPRKRLRVPRRRGSWRPRLRRRALGPARRAAAAPDIRRAGLEQALTYGDRISRLIASILNHRIASCSEKITNEEGAVASVSSHRFVEASAIQSVLSA